MAIGIDRTVATKENRTIATELDQPKFQCGDVVMGRSTYQEGGEVRTINYCMRVGTIETRPPFNSRYYHGQAVQILRMRNGTYVPTNKTGRARRMPESTLRRVDDESLLRELQEKVFSN